MYNNDNNALKYVKKIYIFEPHIDLTCLYALCEQRKGNSADAFMWPDQRLLFFATF